MKPNANQLLQGSSLVSFADVAHQTLFFDKTIEAEQLVLRLIDTPWVQRLRLISQTGNTKLVYMFAEHSRFGHSLGVAYLCTTLMKSLAQHSPELVKPFEKAVAAAALLHDIGHTAPGSHLAETVWGVEQKHQHERIACRILTEEGQGIKELLEQDKDDLSQQVLAILAEDSSAPSWAKAIISGGGWNADRGNWAIVDSAMCSVTYGRYNVNALLDAFRLTEDQQLVLQENRLDALTHFFVARDSMYRQVYQHRVLQAADVLTRVIISRLRDIFAEHNLSKDTKSACKKTVDELNIFLDPVMEALIFCKDYAVDLPLNYIFQMTEAWWTYHLTRWTGCRDSILSDLSSRLLLRKLFKTVRLEQGDSEADSIQHNQQLFEHAKEAAKIFGFEPRYYVHLINEKDTHRRKEAQPEILLDNGDLVPVAEIEPMIAQILERTSKRRSWLAVPHEVKLALGRLR